LDADAAGTSARRAIQKGGAYGKPLIADELILQLGEADRLSDESDRPNGPICIEDLIPIELAVRAIERYARDFLGIDTSTLGLDPTNAVLNNGVLSGATALLNDSLDEAVDVEKLGFARSVLDALKESEGDPVALSEGALARLDSNFRALFRELNKMRRAAVRERDDVKLSNRIARVRDGFLADHPKTVAKADVQELFEEIHHVLDDSPEAEDIRSDLRRLRSLHSLDVDSALEVDDLDALRADLVRLQYGGRQRSQEEAQPNDEDEATLPHTAVDQLLLG
jgi:hypothetical protein